MLVRNAMTSNVYVCLPHESLQKVAEIMRDGDCGAIVIVSSDNKPKGIVTDRDIAMCAAGMKRPLAEINVEESIKDQTLLVCNGEESIEKALNLMKRNKVRRIVVTDRHGLLIGILSMGDIAALTNVPEVHGEHINPTSTLAYLKSVTGHHQSAIIA